MRLRTKKRGTQSWVNRKALENYKVVRLKEVAFVPIIDTWRVLAFVINTFGEVIVVFPIYEVFSVDFSHLLHENPAIGLSRNEFDRYARYYSWGATREIFSFKDMCNIEILIPSIKVQQRIVNLYITYQLHREINKQLKAQIKD